VLLIVGGTSNNKPALQNKIVTVYHVLCIAGHSSSLETLLTMSIIFSHSCQYTEFGPTLQTKSPVQVF
jgi:hypothetical protein